SFNLSLSHSLRPSKPRNRPRTVDRAARNARTCRHGIAPRDDLLRPGTACRSRARGTGRAAADRGGRRARHSVEASADAGDPRGRDAPALPRAGHRGTAAVESPVPHSELALPFVEDPESRGPALLGGLGARGGDREARARDALRKPDRSPRAAPDVRDEPRQALLVRLQPDPRAPERGARCRESPGRRNPPHFACLRAHRLRTPRRRMGGRARHIALAVPRPGRRHGAGPRRRLRDPPGRDGARRVLPPPPLRPPPPPPAPTRAAEGVRAQVRTKRAN